MMKSRFATLSSAIIMGALSSGFALTIDGEAPTIVVDPDNPAILLRAEFEQAMNDELEAAFNNTLETARENFAGFEQQKNLAEAFGNANAYSKIGRASCRERV